MIGDLEKLRESLAKEAETHVSRVTGSEDYWKGRREAAEAVRSFDLTNFNAAPLPILLYCPRCNEQHVDEPQPEKGWDNPPHKSHECQFCGCVWRPSDFPTTGVQTISTVGKADNHKARPTDDATPGVDAARISAWGEGGIEGSIGFTAVPTDFARDLERQRNALQAKLAEREGECRKVLSACKEKLLLYRAEHSGIYCGGVPFDVLMRRIDTCIDAKER